MAYKAKFVIDSLIVGDVSFYSLLLLDNVREEIVNFAQNAIEMSKGNISTTWNRWLYWCSKISNYVVHYLVLKTTNNKRTIEALYQVPSEGGISTNNKAVVELKDEAQAKIDQLIGGSTHLDMVSIVGMPDPSKATLEQQIYHVPLVTSHFDILCLVLCLPNIFQEKFVARDFGLHWQRKLKIQKKNSNLPENLQTLEEKEIHAIHQQLLASRTNLVDLIVRQHLKFVRLKKIHTCWVCQPESMSCFQFSEIFLGSNYFLITIEFQ